MKRVLLGNFTPMMQSLIVEALSSRPDVTLIESPHSNSAMSDGDVDVVLMPAPNPEHAPELMDLLWRSPRTRVVVVATSGQLAVVYELFPRKVVLGDLCPSTLVEAICQ